MAAQLLRMGQHALSEEKNLLHVPLQYMLERLAAQALQPTELREFLRLGQPLHSNSPDMVRPYKPGPPIPLTRIKTLVSMTTPRDLRAHGSCTLPPFVEFDMSSEGFGCLYLPSIAPQAVNSGGNIDAHTIGGIGSGERMFPPQTGLTYSTWFCVDKFSDPRSDPHSVRLLTVIRTVNTPREDNIVCLTLLLSARDKAIIVSTQETLVPGSKLQFVLSSQLTTLTLNMYSSPPQTLANGNRTARETMAHASGVPIYCTRDNGITWWPSSTDRC